MRLEFCATRNLANEELLVSLCVYNSTLAATPNHSSHYVEIYYAVAVFPLKTLLEMLNNADKLRSSLKDLYTLNLYVLIQLCLSFSS